jgi:hypothetical protein
MAPKHLRALARLNAVGSDDFAYPPALWRNRPILDDDLEQALSRCHSAIVILSMMISGVASDEVRLLDCRPDFIQSVSDFVVPLQNVVETG